MIYSYIVYSLQNDKEFIERVLEIPQSIKLISYEELKSKEYSLSPKLFVGYSNVKEYFGNSVNILSNRIDKKNFWCENKSEDLNSFRSNLELFVKEHFYSLISEYYFTYTLTDFIDLDIEKYYENKRSIFFKSKNRILCVDKHFIIYTDNEYMKNMVLLLKKKSKNRILDKSNILLEKYKEIFSSNVDEIEKYIVILNND